VEATRSIVAAGSGGVRAWCVLAGLAAIGAFVLALVVRAALAGVVRVREIASWAADLTAGGERRIAAAWIALVACAAVFAFVVAAFVVIAAVHERFRFHDAGPVALVQAIALVVIAVAIGVAAIAVHRRVAPRLTSRAAWLAGRRARFALAAAAVIAVAAPILFVHVAAPAVSLGEVTVAVVLVVAVMLARSWCLGSHWLAQLAAAVLVAAAIAGTIASIGAARARGLVVVHGVVGKRVARALWALADRDGDGHAPVWIGGADCDDRDRARTPSVIDLAGNHVDENCTGADADPAAFARRSAPRPPSEPAAATRPGVLLISIDALRPDHLGAWGYRRPTSPALDAFAATATRFTWAITVSPSTRTAVPSLLSGRYASAHIGFDDVPMLADVFRDAGYDTLAVLCCDPLVAPRYLGGFAIVDDTANAVRMERAGQANADAVVDAAIDRLARTRRDRPWFAWIHLYDPHHPYAAPAGAPDFGDSDLDRYDAEIAFADRHLARLFASLDRSGLSATTIIAVTADHGDEFSEHGLRFHARSLYNQVVRVPLLVRVPGTRPSVVDTPVSLADIAPTLYDLAGVTGPGGMNGRSLAPAIRGTGPAPARPLLVELIPDKQINRNALAVVADGHKAIWDREANAWSLYALSDPDDTRDLEDEQPERLEALRRTLFDLVDAELSVPP
jgi:arylsulfatase A-like enzyme